MLPVFVGFVVFMRLVFRMHGLRQWGGAQSAVRKGMLLVLAHLEKCNGKRAVEVR